jgi:hypothetical protein
VNKNQSLCRDRAGPNPNRRFDLLRVNAGGLANQDQSNRNRTDLQMNATTATMLANDTITPDELRQILRAGKSACYDAIASGQVPHFRFGGSIHIPSAWVRSVLQLKEAA